MCESDRSEKAVEEPGLDNNLREISGVMVLSDSEYDLQLRCENIVFCSDITYILLSLRNRSGISYESADATFVVEDRRKSRRTVAVERTIFPKSKSDALAAHLDHIPASSTPSTSSPSRSTRPCESTSTKTPAPATCPSASA